MNGGLAVAEQGGEADIGDELPGVKRPRP